MDAKIREAIRKAHKAKPGVILPAEDIYTAIFRAGIKEVVEWINSNVDMSATDILLWQVELKEWGIGSDVKSVVKSGDSA